MRRIYVGTCTVCGALRTLAIAIDGADRVLTARCQWHPSGDAGETWRFPADEPWTIVARVEPESVEGPQEGAEAEQAPALDGQDEP